MELLLQLATAGTLLSDKASLGESTRFQHIYLSLIIAFPPQGRILHWNQVNDVLSYHPATPLVLQFGGPCCRWPRRNRPVRQGGQNGRRDDHVKLRQHDHPLRPDDQRNDWRRSDFRNKVEAPFSGR